MLKFPYREAVGALMWAATMTRPDIACAERAMARFCNPGLAHYFKTDLLHTNEWGITFGEQGCGFSMEASTTRNFWCLGNRRLASGAVEVLAKGVG